MNISLSALFAPENLVSRDGFGSPVPRQPAHLRTQAESVAYLRDSCRIPRRRPFIYFKPAYANGSVPSLSGPANAYRWRSLPRVRRHRGSINLKVVPNECCFGRSPMDQLIWATLSHTQVGMKWACSINLKVVPNECCFGRSPMGQLIWATLSHTQVGMKWAC